MFCGRGIVTVEARKTTGRGKFSQDKARLDAEWAGHVFIFPSPCEESSSMATQNKMNMSLGEEADCRPALAMTIPRGRCSCTAHRIFPPQTRRHNTTESR